MAEHRHPRGLYVLFFAEMWERFSFYLMLGILPLYLSDAQKGGMGWTDEEAAVVVGSYIGLVYFTPFIGGLIADRLLGCRKTILIGGVLMMFGHLVLAWPSETGLYLGLGLLILGNGAFKPNISTLVGNLYPPGSPLKDAGYSIFYMGINIGAFLCNFVAAFVRNHFDERPLAITAGWEVAGWHAAFATAAVGMLLGLAVFSVNYARLASADPGPSPAAAEESLQPLFLQCLLPALALAVGGWFLASHVEIGLKPPTAAFLGACLPAIVFYLSVWRSVPDPADRGRVGALLVIFGVVIVFWMTMMLSSTALVVWARDDTNREPNSVVRRITDAMPELAENAPPSYFRNAGPEVARPARATFTVVSKERYKELQEQKKLNVKEGETVYVTQEMLDRIESGAGPDTPRLEAGKQLKLVNPELFGSINPAYVVLFTPLVVAFFSLFRPRGLEPSTSAKIGLGILLTGGGAAVMLAATLSTGDGASKGSPGWLFGTYALFTLGELCLSPMGLSLVNKMSPANIRAFMMGGWFLSTSFGNKLSGIFGEAYQKMDHVSFWALLIGCNVVFALVVFALLPWLNRQMVEREPTPSEALMTRYKTWALTDVQGDVWIDSFAASNDTLRLPTPHDWSIRKRTLRGGLRDGVDLIEVHNGALSFSVLPTRGMGLWRGDYHGQALGWHSPVMGPVHPKFVEQTAAGGIGWLAGFDELLCRCGLSSNGPPGEDAWVDAQGRARRASLTLHGRIANLPAQVVEVRVSLDPPYELSVAGEVEEAALFFPQLRLRTTYTTVPGSNRVVIHDVIENRGAQTVEVQMLYHCNLGPPFLEAGAQALAPIREMAPLSARAAEGIDTYDTYGAPTVGFAEQVYAYELIGDGRGSTLALLVNATSERAVALRFNVRELPCFTVWKNTGALEEGYVTGLEPATNYPNFRGFERKQGRVRALPPGGRWECRWALEVAEGAASVTGLLAEVARLQAQAKAVIHRIPQGKYSP